MGDPEHIEEGTAFDASADEPFDEHDDDDGDEGCSEASVDDEDLIGNNGAEGSKKKKKKKKKKKSKAADASANADSDSSASTGTGPSSSGKIDKSEADKRFVKALEDVRSGAEMWIKLSSCNVFDGKTKKLFEVLKANDTVTSLDLSSNHISDEGAQSIAAILGLNGAPELIELDLRENNFTDLGLTVLEGLKRMRKQLDLKTGPLVVPTPVDESKELTKGPMFRRYFQVGEQDEEDPTSSSFSNEENANYLDGEISPEELWSKIDLLVRGGQRNIPELTPCLQHLMLLLQRELSNLQMHYADCVVDGTRPHIKGAVHHLATLDAILSLAPDPVMTQFATSPQPAVGTHRLWAAEVLALLLAPGNTVIDRCVVAARLVPRTLDLALSHPRASALQTRALRILRTCCVSKVPDMLAPLMTHGLGAGLTVGGGSGELSEPMQVQLAELGTEQVGILSGKRSPVMGFVIEMCKVLVTCCQEANKEVFNAGLKKTLAASETWQIFSAPGGPLSELCQQQEGDLGGPRPNRVPPEEGGADGDMSGGRLISGQEILALLQGMGAMNAMGG